MTHMFARVLNASVHGTCICLLLILVRSLIKKRTDPRVMYLMWAILAIRLILPAFPHSPLSIYNVVSETAISDNIIERTYDSGTAREAGQPPLPSVAQTDAAGSIANAPAMPTPGVMSVATWTWMAGVLLMISYILICNLRFARKIKLCPLAELPKGVVSKCTHASGLKKNVSVKECAGASTPCVFGILRHTILLPHGLVSSLTADELRYVLMHEMSHIKRNDMLANLIFSFVCALHWFNPTIWLASTCIKADQEVCADYRTMRLTGRENAIHYGETLIKLLRINHSRIGLAAASSLNKSKKELSERLTQIYGYHTRQRRIFRGGIAITIMLGMMFCTSATEIHVPDMSDNIEVLNVIKADSDHDKLYDTPDVEPAKPVAQPAEHSFSLPNRSRKLNYIMSDTAYYYTGDDGNIYAAPYADTATAQMIYDMSGKNETHSTICYYDTDDGYYFTYRTDSQDMSTTQYFRINQDMTTEKVDSFEAPFDIISAASKQPRTSTLTLGNVSYTLRADGTLVSDGESVNGRAKVAYMGSSDGYGVCVFDRVSKLTGEVIDLSAEESSSRFDEIDWTTSGMMIFGSDGSIVFATPDTISRYCILGGVLTYEKSGSPDLFRVNLNEADKKGSAPF